MLRIGLARYDLGLSWSCGSGVKTTPDPQGPFVVTLVVIMVLKDTTFLKSPFISETK